MPNKMEIDFCCCVLFLCGNFPLISQGKVYESFLSFSLLPKLVWKYESEFFKQFSKLLSKIVKYIDLFITRRNGKNFTTNNEVKMITASKLSCRLANAAIN